jgi:hypothetical protein
METYRILMKGSTEKTLDLVFKHGAKLAEAGLSLPMLPTTYTLQVNPIISTVFGIANSVFEVWVVSINFPPLTVPSQNSS